MLALWIDFATPPTVACLGASAALPRVCDLTFVPSPASRYRPLMKPMSTSSAYVDIEHRLRDVDSYENRTIDRSYRSSFR